MRQRQIAKQLYRHIAVFEHERLAIDIAHPAREVDPFINVYPQQAGDSRRGGHDLENQYPADHLFTLLAQHFGQPGQIGGFMMQVFTGDIGAGAVPTHHQPPGDQQIYRLADGHARDAKLFR